LLIEWASSPKLDTTSVVKTTRKKKEPAKKKKEAGSKFSAVLEAYFKNPDEMLIAAQSFKQYFMVSLCCSTQRQCNKIATLWKVYFTKLLGSEEEAKKTYKTGFPWLQREIVV
jgi:hypothetical protein